MPGIRSLSVPGARFPKLGCTLLSATVLSADGRRRDPGGVRAEKDRCQRKGIWDTNISSTVLKAIVGLVLRFRSPHQALSSSVPG